MDLEMTALERCAAQVPEYLYYFCVSRATPATYTVWQWRRVLLPRAILRLSLVVWVRTFAETAAVVVDQKGDVAIVETMKRRIEPQLWGRYASCNLGNLE